MQTQNFEIKHVTTMMLRLWQSVMMPDRLHAEQCTPTLCATDYARPRTLPRRRLVNAHVCKTLLCISNIYRLSQSVCSKEKSKTGGRVTFYPTQESSLLVSSLCVCCAITSTFVNDFDESFFSKPYFATFRYGIKCRFPNTKFITYTHKNYNLLLFENVVNNI